MPRFNQKTPEGRKGYYAANKARIRRMQNAYLTNVRRTARHSIFEILGFKCVRCGFDDIRALQIDHIKGGGVKEARKSSGAGYYLSILKRVIAKTGEFQILCANCNWIKKAERNENPKKAEL